MIRKEARAPARSAADWEEAALRAIAEDGALALSIPELARTLGVTKGSFYWHFRGLNALIEASMRRWEEWDRSALDQVRLIDDPRARLTALFVRSMERSEAHGLYVALGVSAVPEVATVIRRISDRRLKVLVDSYSELGLGRAEAGEQALLAYTAYVGALHLEHQRSRGLSTAKEVAAYVAHAVKTLIPRRRAHRLV